MKKQNGRIDLRMKFVWNEWDKCFWTFAENHSECSFEGL